MAKEVSRSSLFFLVFRDLSNFTGAALYYPLNIYPVKKKNWALVQILLFHSSSVRKVHFMQRIAGARTLTADS